MTQTRRKLIRGMAQVTAAFVAGNAVQAVSVATGALPSASRQATSRPGTAAGKSIVTDIRIPHVLDGISVHRLLLREMIDNGVRIATASESSTGAWRQLLRPDETVAIKCDPFGDAAIFATEVFIEQIVDSIKSTGIAADRIMLIDVPVPLEKRLGRRPRVFGWMPEEVSFGSGRDRLAAWLNEVTAIINVPILKTHSIAGIAGCVFNMSLGIVRRPKLCYPDGCTPYAADILALPQVRSKLRLHIVNGLRVAFDQVSTSRTENTWQHCGILASTDPVATDFLAAEIINDERVRRQLPPIGNADGQIAHVNAAA
ncbi:MAG: DUF362 domain-containing protein, partial [Phycisphaerae bacterium]